MNEETRRNSSRTYKWAITTLTAVLCFLLGVVVQGERLKTQVVTNKVKIELIEKNLEKIDEKLDRILAESR